jgi:antitoxin VapB
MSTTARLFTNGRSQAVRIPKEYRFEGSRVRVRRVGRGVLVEPIFGSARAWFVELDRVGTEPFMPGGRRQPVAPVREMF